jgi:arylformamidase
MRHPFPAHALTFATAALFLGGLALPAQAGPLRDWVARHRAAQPEHQAEQTPDAKADTTAEPSQGGTVATDDEDTPRAEADTLKHLPKGTQRIADVPYGGDTAQRFDVYGPKNAKNAPVIFLVHGGGWRHGSKSARHVVQNKVAHWVGRGLVVVSTDYRLLPDADPLEQARDVAQALTTAQAKASDWGGDAHQFVLMGHSAGAHLVALINASPVIATGLGAKPWLGTVSLDSAALNVVGVMEAKHLRLYDRAFGTDPGFWQATSPWHQVAKGSAPMLAVCATSRKDSCPQAEQYRDKARSLGSRATVLPQPLSHSEVNDRLGLPGAYTQAVDAFLRSLSPELARKLEGDR